MKLYQETKSERPSRPVKKSGNEYLETELYFGNKKLGTIVLRVIEDANNKPNMYLLQWQDAHWDEDWHILREGTRDTVLQYIEKR